MPRLGPPSTGYQALAQDADLTDSDDDESHTLISSHPQYTSIHAPPSSRRPTRPRAASAVDIKVINARLERWADQIANKFKFKHRSSKHPSLEILYSVFVPPEGGVGAPPAEDEPLSKEEFEEVVGEVEEAIRRGVQPVLIKQGSSGSYFARDRRGRVVGVFKPKDEEPYGKLNPKIMKWLHRTLFPCFFGRAW